MCLRRLIARVVELLRERIEGLGVVPEKLNLEDRLWARQVVLLQVGIQPGRRRPEVWNPRRHRDPRTRRDDDIPRVPDQPRDLCRRRRCGLRTSGPEHQPLQQPSQVDVHLAVSSRVLARRLILMVIMRRRRSGGGRSSGGGRRRIALRDDPDDAPLLRIRIGSRRRGLQLLLHRTGSVAHTCTWCISWALEALCTPKFKCLGRGPEFQSQSCFRPAHEHGHGHEHEHGQSTNEYDP